MFNKVQQLFRVLSAKHFRENPKAPQIGNADKRALLVGLINGEQIVAFYNSLTTGLSKGQMRTNLHKYYGVAKPEDAVDILDWLLDEGHRTTFNDILPILKTVTGADARKEAIIALYSGRFQQTAEQAESDDEVEKIKEKCLRDIARAVEFGDNIKGCINGPRAKDSFVAFNNDNLSRGVSAWDLGRLVTVARSAFDAGYIDEQTAWDYIRKAYTMATQEYSTWKELATAYLIGRGMWGGDTMMLNGLYGIAEDCVTKDDSPWKKTTIK